MSDILGMIGHESHGPKTSTMIAQDSLKKHRGHHQQHDAARAGANPDVSPNASRRRRIATGSRLPTVQDVNRSPSSGSSDARK